ncbi:MAG: hypothetical protein AAFP90_18295, partial [Planctomycetota bacterium]
MPGPSSTSPLNVESQDVTVDRACYEIAMLRPVRRGSLVVHRSYDDPASPFLLEDHASGTFYRIGRQEHQLLSVLDGRTTIEDAVAHCSTQETDAIQENQAAAFIAFLLQNQLVEIETSDTTRRMIETHDRRRRRQSASAFGPMSQKLQFGCPAALVRAMNRWVGWCFEGPGLLIWAVMVSVGLVFFVNNLDRLQTLASMLQPGSWWVLILATMGLKVLHECAHAIACVRFGGWPRTCGVLFLLFVPLPFVDVTSAWRIPSRSKRIMVSMAGMYAEWFVAAIAAIVFSTSNSAIVQYYAAAIIFSASLTTLLFNINPLMRFDGYHVLCDLLRMPNLGSNASHYVGARVRQFLFATSPPRRPDIPRVGIVYWVYGVGAWCWKWVVCLSLLVAASYLFQGAGLVLAFMALLSWAARPTWSGIRYLLISDPKDPPNRRRFLSLLAGTAAIGFVLCRYLPVSTTIAVPVQVQCDPMTEVRTAGSGFISTIHVRAGQK